MEIKEARFVTSIFNIKDIPHPSLPEFAFAGKSNVGKSSLINSLTRRKKLVRVSSRPGRTISINFFLINNAFYFVDLPGYGYSSVSKKIKKQWGPLIESYLLRRPSLKLLLLLIDFRRNPSQLDWQLIEWLTENKISYYIIFTKADKVKASQRKNRLQELREILSDEISFILYSSRTSEGRKELLHILASYLQ